MTRSRSSSRLKPLAAAPPAPSADPGDAPPPPGATGSSEPPRRPLSLDGLRTFEAVARRLSFSGASDDRHVTQSAISRQIKALETELGAPLFVRGTRRVELTQAGQMLRRAVEPALDSLDRAVQDIRRARGRRQVSLSTFASLASLWLLPRLAGFQADHPDIDIRLSTSDRLMDLDDPDLDLVLRYGGADRVPGDGSAEALFREWLSPVASPWLLARARAGELPPLSQPADLARHALIEEEGLHPVSHELSWRRWLRHAGQPDLVPRRWVYLNYTHQQVQAAVAGQGVALARGPLVHDQLVRGELVEVFGPALRLPAARSYWLVPLPGARLTPELQAFLAWVRSEAAAMRAAHGSDARPDAPADPARPRM